jgi:hypothetical protein
MKVKISDEILGHVRSGMNNSEIEEVSTYGWYRSLDLVPVYVHE